MSKKSFGTVVALKGYKYFKITFIDRNTEKLERKYFRIDPKTKQPQKAAEKEARKWFEDYERGIRTNTDITLEAWLTQWLETYCQPQRADGSGGSVTQKTYEGYKFHVQYINKYLGSHKLHTLTDLTISKFFNMLSIQPGLGRSGTGLSMKSIKNMRRTLITALNRAVRSGYILKNPAQDTKTPSGEANAEEKVFAFSEEQLLKLLGLAELKGGITHIAVYIAAATGMRIGEVFGLRWQCVDFTDKTIFVNRSAACTKEYGMMLKTTKTGNSRKIEVDDKLLTKLMQWKLQQIEHKNMLGELYEDKDLVIANEYGRLMDTNNFSARNYRTLLSELGLDGFNFHSLRHTHASILIKRGIAINTVSRRLGHSNPSTTLGIYAHLLPDSQSKAVAVMSDVYGS
ncbi:MAG: tyrosine-type recombinase/integrase [Bacillota bacterium]